MCAQIGSHLPATAYATAAATLDSLQIDAGHMKLFLAALRSVDGGNLLPRYQQVA